MPVVEWTFLDPERQQDSAYKRLEQHSRIWVKKDALLAAQERSKSVKKYAKYLMRVRIVFATGLCATAMTLLGNRRLQFTLILPTFNEILFLEYRRLSHRTMWWQ